MNKYFLAAVMALATSLSGPAFAEEPKVWTNAQINNHIDETNFIVGNHCSATLISVTEPMLLTNHHCVDQYLRTEKRQVVGSDGEVNEVEFEKKEDVPVSQRRYEGHQVVSVASYTTTIEAYNEEYDLALLRFRLNKLPNTVYSKIFNGEDVYRGDEVYAVGNPLGLDATLTKGIISSVNRRIEVGGKEHDYLQMDAGIAGGNSGGALYNSVGELIGVPAAAATGTMIGLSIPYTSIQTFLEDNCHDHIFDNSKPSHEECLKKREEEDKKDK